MKTIGGFTAVFAVAMMVVTPCIASAQTLAKITKAVIADISNALGGNPYAASPAKSSAPARSQLRLCSTGSFSEVTPR